MRLRVLAISMCIAFVPCAARAFEGPLQVRNQFPLFIGIDPPYLETAAVQDAVSFALSHSSVYVMRESAAWKINLDIEMTELNLRLKKTIGTGTELGLDLPFLRTEQGFLDRPVSWIHDTLRTGD